MKKVTKRYFYEKDDYFCIVELKDEKPGITLSAESDTVFLTKEEAKFIKNAIKNFNKANDMINAAKSK